MAFAYQTLAESTIRANVWNTLAKLINDNKLSGWTVLASYPRGDASFPCLVIHSPIVTLKGLSLDRTVKESVISVTINFYDKYLNGTKIIDNGKDNVMNTIITNFTTLRTYGLVYEDCIDGDSDSIEEEQLNEGTLTFTFKKIN